VLTVGQMSRITKGGPEDTSHVDDMGGVTVPCHD
jgi:hypothetical protein